MGTLKKIFNWGEITNTRKQITKLGEEMEALGSLVNELNTLSENITNCTKKMDGTYYNVINGIQEETIKAKFEGSIITNCMQPLNALNLKIQEDINKVSNSISSKRLELDALNNALGILLS